VIATFDDRGIADAFYTVLSTGIVLLAGLAISSVVLNAATHQGQAVAGRLDVPGAGYQKGLYAFYYTADKSADFSSADPGRIPPGGYIRLRTEPGVALSKSGLPSDAPASGGLIIWTGYVYVERAGDYKFMLESTDGAWLWVDGTMIADNHGIHAKTAVYSPTAHLSAGYHAFKARYFYTSEDSAWCHIDINGEGSGPEPAFFR
jgi:hypothetical protein